MDRNVASQQQVRLLEADESAEGQRLDNYLARVCKGVPKSHLYRLIRRGQVRVNGRRSTPDGKLAVGDKIRIPPMRTATTDTGHSEMYRQAASRLGRRLPIVFEDEAMIVIDKPAGTAVHGGSGVSSGVIERIRAARADLRYLELVHRLDRDTSGLLMVAVRRSALRTLHADLREHRIRKVYLAIVRGRVSASPATIRLPLHRTLGPDGERRVVVDPQGMEAVTHVRGVAHGTLEGVGPVSLVRIRLQTGRTHQIRVHLSASGHPLLGDPKYGDFALNRELARMGFDRLFLHAAELELRHPLDGRPLRFEAPWPEAFGRLLSAAGSALDGARGRAASSHMPDND